MVNLFMTKLLLKVPVDGDLTYEVAANLNNVCAANRTELTEPTNNVSWSN